MYNHKGLVVVSISVDSGKDQTVRKLIKDYVTRHNLTFLNLLDPKSLVASGYGVSGLPASFFISPQGKVMGFALGYRNWASKEGQKMIEQLFSEIK